MGTLTHCSSLPAPMSPHEHTFIHPNSTSILLRLNTWKSGGCPIRHYSIQHRPKHQSQWVPDTDRLDMPRDSYVIRHLGPDRDYVVMVIAHSEAGLTQGEYAVRTLPAAAIGNGSDLGLVFVVEVICY